jgi:two-component system, cell cycle response regulator
MVGKILIVDAMATNRIVLRVKLSAAFYQPCLAQDGASCIALARTEAPDLILLDHALPDLPVSRVLQLLGMDPRTRAIPVIVTTATGDPQLRMAAIAAGAQDVLTKPVADQILLARIRSLIRAQAALDQGIEAATGALQLAEEASVFDGGTLVALVAQSDASAVRWRNALAPTLASGLVVYSSQQALAEAISGHQPGPVPDVFAIEGSPQDGEGGLRVLSELRSSPAARHSAVCLIRSDNSAAQAALAFDMGADDVFLSAMSTAEIVQRLHRLADRKKRADTQRASVEDRLRQALFDPLTGLYNRRYAMPQLAQIGKRALRDGTSFAAFVLDIDRFKRVNDHHGHAAGDAVLVEVAHRLSANLRVGDLLARIGGEEFLAVLPDVSLTEAKRIADRLCEVIAERPFVVSDSCMIPVTISIGLAISADTPSDEIGHLIEEADHAMLAAKNMGRNQVTISRSAA